MSRLTKQLKTEILTRWFNKNHKERINKEFEDFKKFAVAEFEKKNKKLIDSCAKARKVVSDEYVAFTRTLKIFNMPLTFIPLGDNDHSFHNEYGLKLDCKPILRMYNCTFEINLNDPDYATIKKQAEEFAKKTGEIRLGVRTISNVLNSVTTTKKLLEVAPEFEKYLPAKQKQGVLVATKDIEATRKLLKGGE